MNSSKPIYQVADISLAIQRKDPDLLMEILVSHKSDLWIANAVLLAIDADNPDILKKILAKYPRFSIFHFNIISKPPVTDIYFDYQRITNSLYIHPLKYAITNEKWNCAIEIAKIINDSKLWVNTRWIKADSQIYSLIIPLMGKKQYTLLRILFDAGADINQIKYMDIALKDADLICIGLEYNAKFNIEHANVDLFADEWKKYQKTVKERDSNTYQEIEIALAINFNLPKLLMKILASQSSYSNIANLWKANAILFAINLDKPDILKKILEKYPGSLNFTFIKTETLPVDTFYFSNIHTSSYYTHPLLYAITNKRSDCAIVVANRIRDSKSWVNTKWVESDSQVYTYILNLMKENQPQYKLLRILFDAGVDINKISYIDNALKDKELILIGLKYNAKYSLEQAENKIFKEAWNQHQDILSLQKSYVRISVLCLIFLDDKHSLLNLINKDIISYIFNILIPDKYQNQFSNENTVISINNSAAFFKLNDEKRQKAIEDRNIRCVNETANNKINDITDFINDYNKYIYITAKFNPALDMNGLVYKLQMVLKNDQPSAIDKVKLIDEEIRHYLQISATEAVKYGSMNDFNEKVKLLGEDKVWVFGYKQYKLLNESNKKYIELVRNQVTPVIKLSM